MTPRALKVGDVITVNFPAQVPRAREQEGYRPAIVVGLPERMGILRFSLVFVAPMTTDRGQEWAAISPDLYVRFPAGIAELKSASIVLLDQIRSIDVSRIAAYRGSLTLEKCAAIASAIQQIMELD